MIRRVVVPDVLTAAEVESYRAAMDADREAHPLEWPLGHTYSRGAAASGVLARTDAFDKLASLRDSPVRAVVERLFAPHEPHLCSLSFFVRDANPTPPGGDPTDPLCVTRVWHREFTGQVGLAPESEFFVSSLQCFYYLDDALDTRGHTLACVPESVEAKRAIPIQTDGSGRTRLADDERDPPWPQWETWRDSLGRDQDVRTDGVDVFVPAGAAVLMNNTNFHAVRTAPPVPLPHPTWASA